MSSQVRPSPVLLARMFFGLQAIAGTGWWVAVFLSGDVRRLTLGAWSPLLLVGPDLALFAGASGIAAFRMSKTAAVTATAWTVLVTVALGVYALVSRLAGWGAVLMVIASLGSVAATATIWHGYLPTRWFFVGPFRFRVAAAASGQRHLFRSVTQLIVFWTTFFLVIPVVLRTVEYRLRLEWPALNGALWNLVGACGFALGSALGLWSYVTMALVGHGTPLPAHTARELVAAGPYRFVRNPMALAGAVQTVAVGVWIGSWMVVIVGSAGAVVWNEIIRPVEEADLFERFGESYAQYALRVRCWLPTLRS